MSNFHIDFSNPWLLLLLIPALFLALFPYFRLSKRYRRTRNRIISLVLHVCIVLLAGVLFAGIGFSYEKPNLENELILLVDVSFSNSDREQQELKDKFIRSALDEADESIKIGIVTFGFNQVYAAELSYDKDAIYEQYLAADSPDVTATDVASALIYTRSLFDYPETAKIVLLGDGIETDGKAVSVIRSIAAAGIKVDTVYFGNEYGGEVLVSGVTYPDYNLVAGEEFKLDVSLQSSIVGRATITLYDNGEEASAEECEISEGSLTVSFNHTFTLPGMHEVTFSIECNGDTLEENNTYHSYYYLETFENILIIERSEDESAKLRTLLGEAYTVDVVAVDNAEAMPSTLNELRAYDQVILVNIANADMPEGFSSLLYSYVYEVGGGLFTVGGNKVNEVGETVANSYNKDDMQNTLYQQMLPVQAVNYTPPRGVVIIIDRSGSMNSPVGNTTKLELAKEGARACLDVLDARDYCGITTLETNYSREVDLIPLTNLAMLESAIDNIVIGGSTNFTPAIQRAGMDLNALTQVAIKHIILVTDGAPTDNLWDNAVTQTGGYGSMIKHYYETGGITFSIVNIGGDEKTDAEMTAAVQLGNGYYYAVQDPSKLPQVMANDLKVPEISSYNPEPFIPVVKNHTNVFNGVNEADIPQLGGYYGTKLKEDEGAIALLAGPYGVPVYAQWTYGAGKVGSFMCDLDGTWSADWLNSETGGLLLNNIVYSLMPSYSIRAQDIDVRLEEDNYTTSMSILTELEEGESITVTITSPPGQEGGAATVQTIVPSAAEGYSRTSFVIKQPGIHSILVEKKDADGRVISECLTYRVFSYSAEYNVFIDAEECRVFFEQLAQEGNGGVVTDAWEIFEVFVKTLKRSYDPRMTLAILIIAMFLLDVAVRKFKFKWPHEIVRDRRLRKELEQAGKAARSKK